jgi:hypothetical protein
MWLSRRTWGGGALRDENGIFDEIKNRNIFKTACRHLVHIPDKR